MVEGQKRQGEGQKKKLCGTHISLSLFIQTTPYPTHTTYYTHTPPSSTLSTQFPLTDITHGRLLPDWPLLDFLFPVQPVEPVLPI